jgi:hypothetical protein
MVTGQGMNRKNVNRGFKKLNVWKDSVSLLFQYSIIPIFRHTMERRNDS